jgi:phosphatidylinositol-3-phosphatase
VTQPRAGRDIFGRLEGYATRSLVASPLARGAAGVGAVLLSPCIKPGTVTTDAYNHYSLLRSIEDNFGLPHLGFAGQAGLQPFHAKVLNQPTC